MLSALLKSHIQVDADQRRMYVFGGNTRSSESENLNDMYCYDIERNQWSEVRVI
jgi:N-acetylneuraminic acid mutarotase